MRIRSLARVKSMHRAGVRTMRLGNRQESVGSSLRVSGVCQDGAREFVRRRSRLAGRLSGVAERLAGSWEGLDVDVKPSASDGSTGVAQDFGRLSVIEPPRLGG
ncbi:hypothetical protein GW17_00036012 [Ensete ventricosum]|nr:hypothetical protein GW17_00036012 [Ensete ventricosum]